MAVRIAEHPPAYCAACFQAKSHVIHVDFGAAYDGPTLLDDSGNRQSIDDLIVCGDCVREATVVLALDENPIEQVQRQLQAAESEARAWKAYAETLEETVGQRPTPIKRPPGRPRKGSERPDRAAA